MIKCSISLSVIGGLYTPGGPKVLGDTYDILYLEQLLNEDPSLNLPPKKNEDLKQKKVTKAKPSIEEPPELELKDLPSNLEYAYLEENDKLPVIIAKGLKDDEKEALLKVFKSHKWAIAWKITNIKANEAKASPQNDARVVVMFLNIFLPIWNIALIKNRIFNVGDRVLLFNSRLKIFSGKLKSCWSGPFTVTQVFSYGTIKLSQPDGPNFKVNGHRVKHYFGGDIPSKISLQSGDHIGYINHAKNASKLYVSDGYLFFVHLLLCCPYVADDNRAFLREEYTRYLNLE
ncbi:hypothetical protein Tco_1531439 [Tanacetum coccineum]